MRSAHKSIKAGNAGVIYRQLATGLCTVSLTATLACWGASAAEPFVSSPPLPGCTKSKIVMPDGVSSRIYPSDECGTFFVGPPEKIQANVAASFASVSKFACEAIGELNQQHDKIQKMRAQLADKIINRLLSPQEISDQRAALSIAQEVINDGLVDDYKIFGAKSSLGLTLPWNENVKAFQVANPDYNILPLPTVAGIISFEERIIPAQLEAFGLFDNAEKSPVLSYTVNGLPPLQNDSPLVDDNKLPIFFPVARAERANLKSVQYGGGGVTASVTFNKAGYCQYRSSSDQNPVAFLSPTMNLNMALKTYGTYTVEINIDYLMNMVDTLTKETSGTYYASAIADDFYNQRGENTIKVTIDNDLKNTFSAGQDDAFVQSILYDAATQFLTALTGTAGEKKNLKLPDVDQVAKYKTIQTSQRVCRRSGGIFGIGASTSCWDQAYNIQVLQDTFQRQQAKARVQGSFTGKREQRQRSYVIVPWNANL